MTAGRLHLACNQYVWGTFWGRETSGGPKRGLDDALTEMAAAGIEGYEPSADTPEEAAEAGRAAKTRGLEMRSVYVNTTLHEPAQAEESARRVLAIAAEARRAGARIIVTNPNPVDWSTPANKTDTQLRFQATALDNLGARLREMGLVLAYHHHDAELRVAARELHHMMGATTPAHVSLCLDTHWVYRGAGNSVVALEDIIGLYATRVAELHLRQSRSGVWCETLDAGDIDYPDIVRRLADRRVRPHVVLEQAVEEGSPRTLDVVEAHRRTVAYARRVFAALA